MSQILRRGRTQRAARHVSPQVVYDNRENQKVPWRWPRDLNWVQGLDLNQRSRHGGIMSRAELAQSFDEIHGHLFVFSTRFRASGQLRDSIWRFSISGSMAGISRSICSAPHYVGSPAPLRPRLVRCNIGPTDSSGHRLDIPEPLQETKKSGGAGHRTINWVQGLDLNQRPSGYEPDELPGCSTLHQGEGHKCPRPPHCQAGFLSGRPTPTASSATPAASANSLRIDISPGVAACLLAQ